MAAAEQMPPIGANSDLGEFLESVNASSLAEDTAGAARIAANSYRWLGDLALVVSSAHIAGGTDGLAVSGAADGRDRVVLSRAGDYLGLGPYWVRPRLLRTSRSSVCITQEVDGRVEDEVEIDIDNGFPTFVLPEGQRKRLWVSGQLRRVSGNVLQDLGSGIAASRDQAFRELLAPAVGENPTAPLRVRRGLSRGRAGRVVADVLRHAKTGLHGYSEQIEIDANTIRTAVAGDEDISTANEWRGHMIERRVPSVGLWALLSEVPMHYSESRFQ